MPAAGLSVELLAYTPNALALVNAAMRQCYSDGYAIDIFDKAADALSGADSFEEYKRLSDFIEDVIASGHESPVEHVNFTFAVSGISRALSHQLVRHRIASYSQQSQRYVDANGFAYIIPPAIEAIPKAKAAFITMMDEAAETYQELQGMLIEAGHKATANEDARFVLPNACETRVVFTMNIRALWNFFGLRCCSRAQWEIRAMAVKMLGLCRAMEPALFKLAGAKCLRTGYCNEGPKRTCGKRPLLPVPITPLYTDEELTELSKDWP